MYLRLDGKVQDPQFVRFLETVAKEKNINFGVGDLLVLDSVHRDKRVSRDLKERLTFLQSEGVVERTGALGKAASYILSPKFYSFIGKKGVYTRKKGLSDEANKTLLLSYFQQYRSATMQDLAQVLPNLTKKQLNNLLSKLRQEGKLKLTGEKLMKCAKTRINTRSGLFTPKGLEVRILYRPRV